MTDYGQPEPQEPRSPALHPYLDLANPHSIASLMAKSGGPSAIGKNLVETLKLILRDNPTFFEDSRSDKERRKAILTFFGHEPDEFDNRFRYKFWMEYDLCMHEHRAFNMNHVFVGICSPTDAQKYMRSTAGVAWLLTPKVSYEVFMDEALDYGWTKMRAALDLPLEDPITGKIDKKLLEIQLKLVAMMDMRKHGAFTQNINQKSLNITANMTSGTGKKVEELSYEEVEARMAELEKQELKQIAHSRKLQEKLGHEELDSIPVEFKVSSNG